MKLFAITPDTISIDQLVARVPEIQRRGATHLYLRLSGSSRDVRLLVDAAAGAGIVPVVSYSIYTRDQPTACGVHYTSSEVSLLDQRMFPQPRIITVSAHSSAEACFALQAGADFVYISPVYAPLSKDTERQLFPYADMRRLIAMHGERIIILGGMTAERLQDLAQECRCDFSAAGITFFFDCPVG